ncbi:MAG: ABC transporter ATP-binding protein [Deltaproteobacteria bacterium]|nr:ABC transporter ATP-binding protein [Deltaproteobacteria bacterium]
MTAVALELIGVSKRYGRRYALRDVDLALPQGSALGLLGPNGAGKTSALRILLGFSRPSAGTVRLQGMSPRDPASRVGIAYLPERLTLPGRTKVHSFLRHHAALAGLRGAELDRDVEAVLEQTGLAARASDRIGALSKGLNQRVGFAQAFLARPKLLILDEPTSGLDPIGVRDARDWILAARERGCSVLVSSHLLSEVERTCDQVAIIDEGTLAARGALDEIVQEGETLEDAFVRLVRK